MDNPLNPCNSLQMTPQEERAEKLELLEQVDGMSLNHLRKQAIERRRQAVELDTKEGNLSSVERMNETLAQIFEGAVDPEIAARVFGQIKSGRDYNEAVKAVNGLAELRDRLLDKSIDENAAPTGKKKRIAVAFQTQGVKVATQIEVDE